MKKAIVVGGGPAGASAALGLLRSGFAVTLVEQRTTIGPRVCGAFLDGEALAHLAWLGLETPVSARAVFVRAIRVTTNRGADHRNPLPAPGLSLPRPVLEEILLNAAEAAGGEIQRGVRAGGHRRDGEGWVLDLPGLRKTVRADLLVRADGRFSGGRLRKEGRGWYGWNATFSKVAQSPGEMSLHFYPGGYVGIVTFADGTSNLCGLHRRTGEALDWERVFAEAWVLNKALRLLMEGSRRESPWAGIGPLPFSRGLRPSDGTFRAGDAAAVGDPFMGEGIGRALGAGPLLHGAILAAGTNADPVATYESSWRRTYGKRQRLGWVARSVLNLPRLSSRLIGTVLASPAAVGQLTRVFHGGSAANPPELN
jgi:flavin-dependent dehydrogenase